MLTWSLVIGSSPTVTPGTWTDGAPDSYDLLRGATPLLTAAPLAAVEAYVAVAADVGPDMTLVENASGPGGTASQASAPVAFTPTSLAASGSTHIAEDAVLVSGVADEIPDGYGGAPLKATAVGNRMAFASAGFGPSGDGAYVECGAATETLTKAYSLAAGTPQTLVAVVQRGPATPGSRVIVSLQSGGTLRGRLQTGSAPAVESPGWGSPNDSTGLPDGARRVLVAANDGATTALYVDGALRDTDTGSTSGVDNLRIAARTDAGANAAALARFSFVAAYDGALDAARIATLQAWAVHRGWV